MAKTQRDVHLNSGYYILIRMKVILTEITWHLTNDA